MADAIEAGVTLASSRQVSTWVKSRAGVALAEREAR